MFQSGPIYEHLFYLKIIIAATHVENYISNKDLTIPV